MGETGLHLACRPDLPETIYLLMTYGFDPLTIDDYGRSCIDWASMHQPCILALNRTTLHSTKVISHDVLRKTLSRLIVEALSQTTKPNFNRLDHCLIFIEDKQNAYKAFEKNIEITDNVIQHPASCSRCHPRAFIRGMDRFVCTSCADVDFCQHCFELFQEDEKPCRCKDHEFLKIPRPGLVADSEAETRAWLYELEIRYS